MTPQSPEVIRIRFFPADPEQTFPSVRQPHREVGGRTLSTPSWRDNAEGWADFHVCNICPDEWNVDFAGPWFGVASPNQHRRIARLSVEVTMTNASRYPVQTTGYVFNREDHYVGSLDFRYFGQALPKTLAFDMVEHDLDESSKFLIGFQISGGGTPKIPYPPLITSVSLAVELSLPHQDRAAA